VHSVTAILDLLASKLPGLLEIETLAPMTAGRVRDRTDVVRRSARGQFCWVPRVS